MAKLNKSKYFSSVEKDIVVEKVVEPYNSYRKIQSLIDSRLIYTGRVSGELYEWQRAGDIIAVKEEDAPELLGKRIGERSCCGEGLLGNRIFEEIIGGN